MVVMANHVEKLDVDVATIQHGVEGLMYLITECAKLMVLYLSVAVAPWLIS